MIEKVRKYCDLKWEDSKIDIGYYVAIFIYYFIQIFLFIIFGFLFNNWSFIIIGTVVSTIIHSYTYTHHCHVLENCIILTQIMMICFGYLSSTMDYSWSLLITLISIRYIYISAPIKLSFENKDMEWHKYKAVIRLVLFLIISIILMRLGFIRFSKDILWSITMVAVLLIENKLERV